MRPLVICGSQRFKEELDSFVRYLQHKGVVVSYPNFKHHRKRFIEKPEEQRLKCASYKAKVPGMVHTHLQKIREMGTLGGVCLIFNPLPKAGQKSPNGYIGKNTTGEIFYANAFNVLTIMLRPHEDESIMSLVPRNDRGRIFAIQHPKLDPADWDAVWHKWLKGWLNGK